MSKSFPIFRRFFLHSTHRPLTDDPPSDSAPNTNQLEAQTPTKLGRGPELRANTIVQEPDVDRTHVHSDHIKPQQVDPVRLPNDDDEMKKEDEKEKSRHSHPLC